MSRFWTHAGTLAALVIVAGCAAPSPVPRAPSPGTGNPTPPAELVEVLVSSAFGQVAEASQPGSGPLRTSGGDIVDAKGRVVRITGVNWFGLETGTYAPHGLWARNLDDMLDQIAGAGFNTIRLPYSNQLFEAGSAPNGVDFTLNPDLDGLSGLQVMDQVIQRAGERGLKVILDRHRPTSQAQSELWYTDRVSEQRWIDDWVKLASRYRGNPTVIGADLHNEPRGPATWGDGNQATDWRAAAERAGNAVLAANPDWLIFVEGIERHGDDWYWWGGNLAMAGTQPVRLSAPDKLVYEAHDYGPGVYNQTWFHAPDFPLNLPGIWHSHWAYLKLTGTAPVLLGEFGGRSVGTDKEGVWQRALMAYLQSNEFDYTYWSWNANSSDTGGILDDDWTTLNHAKMSILKAYQWPLIGEPVAAANARAIIDAYQGPTLTKPAPQAAAAPSTEPSGSFAIGGPFDPDPQHAHMRIGGPNDADPLRRMARQADERRYVELHGRPWEHAVYVTAAP
jgi:endoglucanase